MADTADLFFVCLLLLAMCTLIGAVLGVAVDFLLTRVKSFR